MDDTNVQLTLDLGTKALVHLGRPYKIHLLWDLGPNITMACKYLAGSLVLWKSVESITNILVAWISTRKRSIPQPPTNK